MSRATRTARGVAVAFISSVLAATSHTLAGDTVTPIAVLVTAIIALPLCVALAGRLASAWRVALAVGLSQFFFHWTFVGLGAASTAAASTPEAAYLAKHAAHLGLVQRFAPAAVEAGAADSVMWIFHAIAAVVTIALVLRGERTAVALLTMIRRALPQPVVRAVIHAPTYFVNVRERASLSNQLLTHSPRSLRGPPALQA